jgi:hypothetical protein
MKHQHVANIDNLNLAATRVLQVIDGADPGVVSGILPAAVGVTVGRERRSPVGLSQRPA